MKRHMGWESGSRVACRTLLAAGMLQVCAAEDRLIDQTKVDNDDPSLLDFVGSTPDQKFASAKAKGVKWLRIPSGTYATAGWAVAESDSLLGITFDTGAQLVLTAATNAIGIDIQKTAFHIKGIADVVSSGTQADRFNTIGVRGGHPTLGGKPYLKIEECHTSGFSYAGVAVYQPVFFQMGASVHGHSRYGVTIEAATIKGAAVGGTTVVLGSAYATGCTRGLNFDRCAWVTLEQPITEYCGSATSIDGALHFNYCRNVTVNNRYHEENFRNVVKNESTVVFTGTGRQDVFAAAAADVVTYKDVGEGDRGTTQITSRSINTRRIDYDTVDNQPLVIGSNLTVPVDGSSVKWGNTTTEMIQGTVSNNTWTTVKAMGAEMTGANEVKAFYQYVAYAGLSDLSTGFDAGTIFNDVARSYSGTLPGWLRMSGQNLQIKISSSSYGLNYKVVLTKTGVGL